MGGQKVAGKNTIQRRLNSLLDASDVKKKQYTNYTRFAFHTRTFFACQLLSTTYMQSYGYRAGNQKSLRLAFSPAHVSGSICLQYNTCIHCVEINSHQENKRTWATTFNPNLSKKNHPMRHNNPTLRTRKETCLVDSATMVTASPHGKWTLACRVSQDHFHVAGTVLSRPSAAFLPGNI